MANEGEENIISHLEALRAVLIKCLAAIFVVLIPAFYAAPKCLNILLHHILGGKNVALNYFSPVEVFLLQIKLALVLDAIVCFPYIARQIWNFTAPALYAHEKKFITKIIWASSLLFAFGAVFCLYFIMPMIIKFGLSFATSEIKPILGVTNIVNLALWLSVAFGLMFQFPLITASLIKSGLVSYETASRKRPFAVIGILILSALLTPPDIISQILLFVPTYLLFEAGLFVSRGGKNG